MNIHCEEHQGLGLLCVATLREAVWAWEGVEIYCVDLHIYEYGVTLKETRGKTERKYKKKENQYRNKQRRIGKQKQTSVKKMKDRRKKVIDKGKTGKKNDMQKFRKEGRKKKRDIVECLANTHTYIQGMSGK